MLEKLTNPDIIDLALDDPLSNKMVLELADRLQNAVHELDRMTQTITKLEHELLDRLIRTTEELISTSTELAGYHECKPGKHVEVHHGN